jgi:hypothetical protein
MNESRPANRSGTNFLLLLRSQITKTKQQIFSKWEDTNNPKVTPLPIKTHSEYHRSHKFVLFGGVLSEYSAAFPSRLSNKIASNMGTGSYAITAMMQKIRGGGR